MSLLKYWRNASKELTLIKKITLTLFTIFLIILFWIIVLKLNVHQLYKANTRSINLIPFTQPTIINNKTDYGEMILNVLVFIPLGLFSGALYKRWTIIKQVFLFFSVSYLCESFQYIFGTGASDITDIIDNTLGGLIGLMTFRGIEKAYQDHQKAQKLINIIGIIGTLLILLLLIFLKLNHLWIFRMQALH
jgi:glycopeptide antibiotics resistance protein